MADYLIHSIILSNDGNGLCQSKSEVQKDSKFLKNEIESNAALNFSFEKRNESDGLKWSTAMATSPFPARPNPKPNKTEQNKLENYKLKNLTSKKRPKRKVAGKRPTCSQLYNYFLSTTIFIFNRLVTSLFSSLQCGCLFVSLITQMWWHLTDASIIDRSRV